MKGAPKITGVRPITVLVLLPTKELCQQVYDVFNMYSNNIVKTEMFATKGLPSHSVAGSVFDCDVLVTTPMSLLSVELLLSKLLKSVQTVVFDEADSLVKGEGRGLCFLISLPFFHYKVLYLLYFLLYKF